MQLLEVTDDAAWRAWLERRHDSADGAWLVFYKGHTGKARLTYEEALEEALCWGWIDSLVKRVDATRYARKFTPRKPGSRWSASNRRRVARLVREGRMTPAGMAKVSFSVGAEDDATAVEDEERAARHRVVLDAALERELRADAAASASFDRLAPSHRRNYVGWIMSAKRDETRRRRLAEAIGLLRAGRKLGLK